MSLETNSAAESVSPIALVNGESLSILPKDLYIPPDALEIILETFEGPMDLLLYLIKKQNLDILDIPIAEITHQYMQYIELMTNMRLELAAEYLVMAAMLAEIKSRMLLPRLSTNNSEEVDDPRAELIRRLQEYERFKKAAADMDALPRMERDLFSVLVELTEDVSHIKPLPNIELKELVNALHDVLTRAKLVTHHHIQREVLSVRERMTRILGLLVAKDFIRFDSLFDIDEGRLGVVVTFVAMLELLKQNMIEIVQAQQFGPIHIKAIE